MKNLQSKLDIKIYADGADIETIRSLRKNSYIKGFTTNPTLMRKAGVDNYENFARELIQEVPDLPVSLEVFADDLQEMEGQARKIASWGENVFVKIPVMNTAGIFTDAIINNLSKDGICLNITAIMTEEQVLRVQTNLSKNTKAIISVFAGRIADTGIDPIPVMEKCLQHLQKSPLTELLWASPRELLNIFQASKIGCHIITVPPEILSKMSSINKDLNDFSKETVEMFYQDAVASGYKI